MNTPHLKGLDLRSEEVEEMMGSVPSWIQRWGITVVLAVIAGAIALCGIIKLPERHAVKLTPLRAGLYRTAVVMPEDVTIKRILAADGSEVELNDTLIIFSDNSAAVAPIVGTVRYIGPAHPGVSLPAGTELLKLTAGTAGMDSLTCYGYVPRQVAERLHAGQRIDVAGSASGRLLSVAAAPNSQGLRYIEAKMSFGSADPAPCTADITLSSETILQKLLASVRRKGHVMASLPE